MGASDLTFGLDDPQLERYARHLILPEVGGKGQRALCDGAVHLTGEGAAAAEALAFLAAAGVGRVAVTAAIPEAILAHVRALNPEVVLTEDAAGLAAPDPAPSATALPVQATGSHGDGALAALEALLSLIGRPAAPWRVDADVPGLGPTTPATLANLPTDPHPGTPR